VLYNATTINPTTELVFCFIEALLADPQWKKAVLVADKWLKFVKKKLIN